MEKLPEAAAALTPIAVIAHPERYANIQVHTFRPDCGNALGPNEILLAVTKSVIVVEAASHYNNHQARSAESLVLITAKQTNTEIVALNDQVEHLRRESSAARGLCTTHQRAFEEAAKKVIALTAQVDQLTEQAKREDAKRLEKEGAKRLLETHLARVRNYFGEKAFHEAISSENRPVKP